MGVEEEEAHRKSPGLESSETSAFLPVTSSLLMEDSEDENPGVTTTVTTNSISSSSEEDVRRCSRNLGILVISEGLPMIEEKEVKVEVVGVGDKLSRCDSAVSKRSSKCMEGVGGGVGGGDEESGGGEERGKKRQGCCRSYAGILLTLASGLVYTIGGVIVKYMNMNGYHPFTLGVYRFQGVLIPSVLMVLYEYRVKKVNIFEPVWPPLEREKRKKVLGLVVRCVFGTTALFLHFYALQRLDVADALVIGACQPVFVTLAAYFCLGEACGIFPVFTALLTIIGVGVISRPPILTGKESFDEDSLIGAGFSLASMLTATMVYVVIRYLKDLHVSLLTLILGCWGTLQSVVCAVAIGEFKLPESLEHWALAGGLALITLLGQVALTLALQLENAGPVSLIKSCDSLFAFVLQFILLGTVPDLYSLTGAAIIIFCVVLTAFRKWVSMLPQTHPARGKFAFVMK